MHQCKMKRFVRKMRRLVTMAFVTVSVCTYILLAINIIKWKEHQRPQKYSPIRLRPLSNVDRCMDNFDFQIVNQSVTDSHKLHPIKFLPNLRNPCWFEFFNKCDVKNIFNNPYITLKEDFKVQEQLTQLKEAMNQRFKSSSWYSAIRLRCLPFFIIIGQPNSGSTDLYRRLELHPQLEMGILKEPNWWTRSVFGQKKNFYDPTAISFNQYVDLNGLASIKIEKQLTAVYCNIKNESKTRTLFIGEGSIVTFSDPSWMPKSSVYGQRYHEENSTPKYLKWISPQTKIIVLLREPVARLLSDYLFNVETDTISAADFHYRVEHSITLFNKCRRRHGEHFCVNDKDMETNYTLNIHRGLYSLYLKDWLTTFPRENILVLQTEDYADDEVKTLQTVFKFLDLEVLTKDFIGQREIINKSSKSIGEVWSSTKKQLKDFYQPYNMELAELLQDKRFLWT